MVKNKRQKLLKEITEKHEQGIKEVTKQRKEIANSIAELQAKDKELAKQQQNLLKKRDEEIEESRQKAR